MDENRKLARVLVVDDEKSVRKFLKLTLDSNGYEVFEASDGEQALQKSVSTHPDVVVLDLGLPDLDGVDVIHEIRRRSRIPIVIVSVRDELRDKLTAFEAGADDYLTKPFDPAEILARLKAVLRRLVPAKEETVFTLRGLSVDVSRRRVVMNEKEVALSPTEYDILKALILAGGAVLTHRRILAEVWGRAEAKKNDPHIVRATVRNLRAKLEPNHSKPAYVLSIPGVGYRIADA